jgi:hypothetical protein
MRAQGFTVTRLENERGIALITTLLVMMLMSALLVGFTTVVMSDQRYRLIDRDRVRSFYAAHSGLEKLNTDLSNLFLANVAPTAAQIAALKDNPPSISDVTFIDTGDAAYGVKLESTPAPSPISTGPYQGLVALKRIYRLDATARTADGGETHLMRRVETVTIPVFQFGVFSDVDLSFHAGPSFNFGGRVHSNRDLYIAQGNGNTLTLPERVTTVRDVIRKTLANGNSISVTGHTGTVRLATAPGAFRNLLDSEGSVEDGAGSAANLNWPTISLSTYNGYIRNTATGAKRLDLPLLTTGGANADLIRRPGPNEDIANPDLLASRYFNNVSLRILLSDTAADITSLPTVTPTAPVELDNEWLTTPPNNGTAYGPVDATHNPIAESPGRIAGNPTVTAAVATGTAQTINVTDFPVAPTSFKLPTAATGYLLSVTKSGTTGSPFTVYCSGKTATTFTDCSAATKPYSSGSTTLTGITSVSMILPDNTSQTGVTGASWSSTNWTSARSTITVTAGDNTGYLPNLFAVTVKKGTATYRALCSGKNQTQFTGCIADPTAPSGQPTSAVSVPAAYDVAYITPTDGNQTATNQTLGANWNWTSTTTTPSTLTVGNASGTMTYTTNTFWVFNANQTEVLVTCTGYQLNVVLPPSLTGCNVTGALQANATIESASLSNANVGLIGGFIKIERQDASKVWHDVTMEILNYGISGPNLRGRICDPSPNAIIRLQRLRDNAETGSGACSYLGTTFASDFVPNTIFDTREALYRDAALANNDLALGGVMHYVSINVANLSDWFEAIGAYAGGTGAQTLKDNNGFSVYFSDRRNNRNASNQETGEFGFEDIINPLSATGTPNGVLDIGEDANGSGTLETYGDIPNFEGNYNSAPTGSVAPLTNAARLNTAVRTPYAMHNRAMFFRRGLKLTNGGLGNIVMPGLTIAAENAVYIHGSWNANSFTSGQGAQGEPNSATSVVADSLTLLSDNWNDVNSFTQPYALGGTRARSANSYYRLAIIAGKNQAFPWPSAGAPPSDFGTDGGIHNFLRMLESGGTVHYRGSIATFFYSRQGVGVYKCCSTVYGAPTRNFAFDTDFLDPALLPPLTPMFRDTNSLGFAQEVRPGK